MSKTLLTILSTQDHLLKAWKQLRKTNKDSHGLSGRTIENFEKNLSKNIEKISKELSENKYNFSPYRACTIKKDNGKHRPLQIPEIRDRVVLKALAMILEQELESLLLDSKNISFAYQKGLGVKNAVLQMQKLYNTSNAVILKADIINFFEEVDKEKLLTEKVYRNLRDDSINQIIAQSLSQCTKGMNRLSREKRKLFKNCKKGIPQGNPLSPLLSNVYLIDFDKNMKNQNYKLVRYADDFIIICDNVEEAKKAYVFVSNFLTKELKLKIHPLDEKDGKTQIINPTKKHFSFLSIVFNGEKLKISRKKLNSLKGKLNNKVGSSITKQEAKQNIEQTIKRWISIYNYIELTPYFNRIEKHLKYLFRKQFGKKSPYIFSTCQEIADSLNK